MCCRVSKKQKSVLRVHGGVGRGGERERELCVDRVASEQHLLLRLGVQAARI